MLKHLFNLILLLGSYVTIAQFDAKKLDEILDNYEQNDFFSGVILIAQQGEMIYNRNIGYADLQNEIRLDVNTPMHLASNTKAFTNMGVLILAERGLISYDDKVAKYREDFPYPDVTIRHLMTSTSGLKRLYNKDLNKDGIISNEELMTFLSEKKPKLSFVPGDKFQSSVVGFCVLAEIISQVSGKDYIQFMKDEIFTPLEMNETFIVTEGNMDRFRAISYNEKNKIEEWYLGSYIGGVSIYASASDVLKWDQSLYSEVLVPNQTIDLSYEKFRYNDGTLSHVTLGSWMRWKGQENLIFKNGDWVANNSILWRDIENNTTIIIMNNRINKITKYDLMDTILPLLGYQQ